MQLLKSISAEKQHAKYLDGLRSAAFLMVLAHHAIDRFQKDFPYVELDDWVRSGHHGVHLLFILSAFTLFCSSTLRFEKEKRPILNFYLRRAFRILPFFWLNIAFVQLIWPRSFLRIFENASFAFGLININHFMVPGSWSLFVEETFYLTFPLIFLKFIKNTSATLWGLVFFILIRTLWFSWMISHGHSGNDIEVWSSPIRNYFWFFLGMMLAQYQLNQVEVKANFFEDRKTDFPYLFDFLILIGMGTIHKYDDLTIAGIFGLLIITASYSNTITGKICRSRILGAFGVCCYSIYFIHFYVLDWSRAYLQDAFGNHVYRSFSVEIQYGIYFLLLALVSLIFGILSFNFFEVPFLKMGRKVILKCDTYFHERQEVKEEFIGDILNSD